MKKVTLLVAEWCPVCPQAERLWEELGEQYEFKYRRVDVASDEGLGLARKHGVLAVPVTLIDDEVVFSGVPQRDKAINAIK